MRAHARVEDTIARVKDAGDSRFPFTGFDANAAWGATRRVRRHHNPVVPAAVPHSAAATSEAQSPEMVPLAHPSTRRAPRPQTDTAAARQPQILKGHPRSPQTHKPAQLTTKTPQNPHPRTPRRSPNTPTRPQTPRQTPNTHPKAPHKPRKHPPPPDQPQNTHNTPLTPPMTNRG